MVTQPHEDVWRVPPGLFLCRRRFGSVDAFLAKNVGALGMSLAHGKIKAKYDIDDERALFEKLGMWESEWGTGRSAAATRRIWRTPLGAHAGALAGLPARDDVVEARPKIGAAGARRGGARRGEGGGEVSTPTTAAPPPESRRPREVPTAKRRPTPSARRALRRPSLCEQQTRFSRQPTKNKHISGSALHPSTSAGGEVPPKGGTGGGAGAINYEVQAARIAAASRRSG